MAMMTTWEPNNSEDAPLGVREQNNVIGAQTCGGATAEGAACAVLHSPVRSLKHETRDSTWTDCTASDGLLTDTSLPPTVEARRETMEVM